MSSNWTDHRKAPYQALPAPRLLAPGSAFNPRRWSTTTFRTAWTRIPHLTRTRTRPRPSTTTPQTGTAMARTAQLGAQQQQQQQQQHATTRAGCASEWRGCGPTAAWRRWVAGAGTTIQHTHMHLDSWARMLSLCITSMIPGRASTDRHRRRPATWLLCPYNLQFVPMRGTQIEREYDGYGDVREVRYSTAVKGGWSGGRM